MASLARWLHSPGVDWYVTHHFYAWPACETLHFMGLALLFGTVGVFDLRLLGVAKRMPLAPLHRLLPWGVLGFGLTLITGAVFVLSSPFSYLLNLVFPLKMLFVLLAGVNVLLFYGAGVFRQVDTLGPGEEAPTAAKVVAAISLFLWIGVMFLGRMLPFIGGSI